MQASMYSLSVPVFVKTLTNLSAVLDKAVTYAETRRIDPAVLLNARLFPDMFHLTRQIQTACDFAKGTTARLAGQEPPKWEDKEASFGELKARIARTIEFVQTFAPAAIDGAEERTVEVTMRGEPKRFQGLAYLTYVALPNFFFHAVTAYDILRHNGVELGKRDFIGSI